MDSSETTLRRDLRQIDVLFDEPVRREPVVAAPSRVALMNVEFDSVTETEVTAHVCASLAVNRGGWIITPNLDHLRRSQSDSEFMQMLHDADLVVADGMPLVWASRIAGRPLPERVAGSALVTSMSKKLAENGRSVYLLGGAPGAAEGAKAKLCAANPDLNIVGVDCPDHGFESDPAQMAVLKQKLLDAQPDVIYVALGSPKQERLIERLRHLLPYSWWIGVGFSFSFLSGQVPRAPRWVQRIGMEWMHRLCQEPRRLAKRYLLQGLPFAMRLLISATAARLSRPEKLPAPGAASDH